MKDKSLIYSKLQWRVVPCTTGAATITSCSKNDGSDNARQEVKIVTSIAGMTGTRADIDPVTGRENSGTETYSNCLCGSLPAQDTITR